MVSCTKHGTAVGNTTSKHKKSSWDASRILLSDLTISEAFACLHHILCSFETSDRKIKWISAKRSIHNGSRHDPSNRWRCAGPTDRFIYTTINSHRFSYLQLAAAMTEIHYNIRSRHQTSNSACTDYFGMLAWSADRTDSVAILPSQPKCVTSYMT